MIRAVLFDLDGVLVDSLEGWFKLFNKTLKHFDREEFTFEKFVKDVWGGPIERDAEKFFGKPVDDVINYYFDNFDELKKKLKLFPNVKETLKELKNRNLKIGLVTNTPKKQLYKLLDSLKIKEFFDAVVGGDEVKNGKPAPDMILEACKRLVVNPGEVVLVGDTNADILSCKNAGCGSIGFRINGNERIDDLKELLTKI